MQDVKGIGSLTGVSQQPIAETKELPSQAQQGNYPAPGGETMDYRIEVNWRPCAPGLHVARPEQSKNAGSKDKRHNQGDDTMPLYRPSKSGIGIDKVAKDEKHKVVDQVRQVVNKIQPTHQSRR